MPAEPARTGLLAAKLRSLLGSRVGDGALDDVDFPGGAALVAGSTLWVLLDRDPVRSFGPALVLADRRGVEQVDIVTEDAASVLARRAGCFEPAADIWRVTGTELRRAEPAPAAVAEPAPYAPALAELLVDADLEVVVEGGVVRGEVNGLEVARIVHDHASDGTPIDQPQLEVGVGQADRELTSMLHAGLSPTDKLARVAEIVRSHRRPGAEPHPLNKLVPERWLRARLLADPGRLGLSALRPIPPALPRANLRDTGIAAALGDGPDGETVVVACSVGIDLDLVPAAADTRLAVAPGARLVLAVPARDAHPITLDLAARLASPAEVVAVDDDWRA